MATLTVRQLINRLKKMPQSAKVCFAAHDQDPERGEFDGTVSHVEESPAELEARGYGVVLS